MHLAGNELHYYSFLSMSFASTNSSSKLAKKLAYQISVFKRLYTISPINEMAVKTITF